MIFFPPGFPPGERGLPFLGVLPYLGEHPHNVLKEWSYKHGDIMAIKLGTTNAVIISSQSALNEVFVKKASAISDRFTNEFFDQIFMNRGIFNSAYTERLKMQRKFVHQALHRNLINNKTPEERINEEIQHFIRDIYSQDGKPFHSHHMLLSSVTNVICSIVLGKRFEYNDKWFTKIMSCIVESLAHSGPNFLLPISIYPWLIHFPPFRRINVMFRKSMATLSELIQQDIDEHKSSFDENNLRDLIDAFLFEMKKEDHHSSFDELQLCVIVRELLLAGNETTGSQIAWLLLALMHYPEWQDRVHREIVDNIGENGVLRLDDRKKLPCTCAFIQEILRLHSIGSLNAPHKVSRDTEVKGYKIPAGTMVMSNVYAIHTDPKVWTDPETFDPSRHLNETGSFINSSKMSPFSLGPRQCIGKTIAENKLFLYFGNICQKFRIVSETPTPITLHEGQSGFVFSPKEHKVIAIAY
ncbi:cytochrome P450 2J4-like [Ciona intestinalis]